MIAPHSERRLTRRELAAMGLLLAIAAALRLWRLGALGLEVDEGIQGLTAQGWLRSGLPLLPSGLVYQRAIPFSALQAVSAWFFGLDEFALRLPAALFGVASVAATFALARALFGNRVAWVAATFIALSGWEIELSRYARFYTAFQVAWVLAFLCLFRALTQDRPRYWRGFAAATVAAMSVHELSILLATCLLLPLLDRRASWTTRAIAVAAMVPLGVVWIAFRRGTGPLFTWLAPPHGLEVLTPDASTPGVLSGYPSVRVPFFDARADVLREQPFILAVLVTLVLTAAVLIVRWRSPHGWRSTVLPIVAVALGAAHLFVLAAIALVLHVAWLGTSLRAFWNRVLLPAHAALGLLLAIWTVLLHRRLEGEVKAVVLALFGFPNVLQHFFYWFALGWPVFLAIIVVTGIAMFDRFLRTGDRSMLYALGGIAAPVLVASTYESFHESRYVFHVYPLLAIVFAWGLTRVAEAFSARPSVAPRSQVVFAAVVAIGFLVSSDVGARTWDPVVRTHASARDPMRSVISWRAYAGFHQDHKSPSLFVVDQASEGDRVAVIATLHQLAVYHFYLGRIDASLGTPGDVTSYRRKNGRIVDRTTGSDVVFDPEQLARPQGAGRTWLLADEVLLSDDVQAFPTLVRSTARAFADAATYRGRDGVTFVRRFP